MSSAENPQVRERARVLIQTGNLAIDGIVRKVLLREQRRGRCVYGGDLGTQ